MNIVNIPSDLPVYWAGWNSNCYPNGAILYFLRHIDLNITLIFTQTDGIVTDDMYKELSREISVKLLNEKDLSALESNAIPNTVAIICSLCTRGVDKKNILLLPLDDHTFEHGLNSIFKDVQMMPWENREAKVFWSGNPSGYERPATTRERVVAKLYDNIHSDCRFCIDSYLRGDDHFFGPYSRALDAKYKFQPKIAFQDFFKYKYLLIIDGISIASNHQWVFASGAVPIMVTHPENNWWFKKFLVPMVHYVPIEYDLSDLEDKIQWLVDNDDKAREIAENALKFSEEVFSSEFQKKYLINELNDIIHKL